jgi:hypothetical protein
MESISDAERRALHRGEENDGHSLGVRVTWEFTGHHIPLLYVTLWIFMDHSASSLEVPFCVLNLCHAYESQRQIFQSTEKNDHLKWTLRTRFVVEIFSDKSISFFQ